MQFHQAIHHGKVREEEAIGLPYKPTKSIMVTDVALGSIDSFFS
jgi:hypothetical protein